MFGHSKNPEKSQNPNDSCISHDKGHVTGAIAIRSIMAIGEKIYLILPKIGSWYSWADTQDHILVSFESKAYIC